MKYSTFEGFETQVVLWSSVVAGLFLFYCNTNLSVDFKSGIEWYYELSNSLFSSNTAYYAESILVPLLAKIVGANSSLVAYKLFCSFLTISILPMLAVALLDIFLDIKKVVFVLIVFAFSFTYLREYVLGFPDPLTIILLNFVALKKNGWAKFVFVFFASLSHFSIAAVSTVALAVPLYFSAIGSTSNKTKQIAYPFCGLIVGKLALSFWYMLFSYRLSDRVDWVKDHGFAYFLDKYEQSPWIFFTTPGLTFLLVCLILVISFFWKRKYMLGVSLVFSLSVAYLVRFFTIDGLRNFAPVVCCSYVLALAEFANMIFCNNCLSCAPLDLIRTRRLW